MFDSKGKNIAYRVCHEGGNAVTGAKIYELYGICECSECLSRRRLTGTLRNQATATTKDISKITEVHEFLKEWRCADGTNQLKTEYFEM